MALSLPSRISVREVGLRDGLQIENPISTSAKLELLDALAQAGIQEMEATAFVSPRAVPALADHEEIAAQLPKWPGISWSALVATQSGAERALAHGVKNLEYVVSANDGHSLANVKRTTAEATAAIAGISELVHQHGGTIEVIVATAWDCPFDGPTRADDVVTIIADAEAHGVDRICLGDTIGTVTPRRLEDLVSKVRDAATDIPLGLHMHNTRGTALASVIAGMNMEVTRFDASIGGLGGCPFAPGASGNLATEELVYMLDDCGIETGIDLPALIRAARLAQDIIGRPLPSGVLRAGNRRLVRAS